MAFFSLQFSKAGYVADFLAYVLWVAIALAMLARFGARDDFLEFALLLGGGLVTWTLLEYLLHRFVLHGLEPFRSMHAQHHQHPQALIGISTAASASLFAALVFAPAVAMMDLRKGTAFTLGVVIGYIGYGWIHHAAHHWRPGTHWLKRRKQVHALHHRAGNCHYGVTTSFWDRVFRSGFARQGRQGPPA